MRNGNCEQGCEGDVDSKEFHSRLLKGVLSHKRVRVYNNFKSEYIIIELKVYTLIIYSFGLSTCDFLLDTLGAVILTV